MLIKDQRGFSLVEVMISLVILAFGMLGTISMFSASEKALSTSSRMTMALRLAQEKLESKKAVSFESLLLDDMDGDGILETRMVDDSTAGDEVAGDGIYTGSDISLGIVRRWTVSLNTPIAGIAKIDVVTSWVEDKGIKRSVTLSTIKIDGGYR